MKRLLAIAFSAAAITLFVSAPTASAADYFHGHGGQHGSHSSHPHRGYGYPHSGHGHSSHHGYGGYSYTPSYQFGSNYRGRSSRYPTYSQGYGGSRHYGHGGGLHLDIGRFHLGLGDHH